MAAITARRGAQVSHPRPWTALLAATAFLAGSPPAVRGQTYSVVLSVNDPRPMAQAVLALIRSYPVTITYEDPRYEFAGDLREVTRPPRETLRPQVGTVVPRGGVFQAAYDVAEDTGQPVDLTAAIQSIIDANNQAPHGAHFALRRSGDIFHVVPAEIRDGSGRWMPQRSILDVPITFSSAAERGAFELLDAILKEISAATGRVIIGRYASGPLACGIPCAAYDRKIDARNEPARDVLMRLLHSLNPRYTWVVYYGLPERSYVFNLVLGKERAEPQIEQPRPTPKPGDQTPPRVPFNLASTRSGPATRQAGAARSSIGARGRARARADALRPRGPALRMADVGAAVPSRRS